MIRESKFSLDMREFYTAGCGLQAGCSGVDRTQYGGRNGKQTESQEKTPGTFFSAYVTSRILPGMIVIHHGGQYRPDKDGVDWGCTPNIFFTDSESPVTAPHVSNLVQVERFNGPDLRSA